MAVGSGLSAATRMGLGAGAAALLVAGAVYWAGPGSAPDQPAEPAVTAAKPAVEAAAPAPAAEAPVESATVAAPAVEPAAAPAAPAATETSASEPAATEAAATEAAAAEPAATEAAATEPAAVESGAAESAAEPVAAAPAPVAAAEAPAVAEPAPVADLPAIAAPSFDVVRVEPDGSATVAGRAAPGARVSLRVDGAEVASTIADGQGNFVALFDLGASAAPRLMSAVAVADDGAEIAGPQTLAVAPTVAAQPAEPAPEPVAATEAPVQPEPAAAPSAPEAAAPAAIMVSPEGVTVVQPGASVPADVAANVGIDSISYAADGAVLLGGHGQAAALLRVYLDDAALSEATVGPDGQWRIVLPEVAPGLYRLRVDQVDGTGKVNSRFETPFKRETLAALAAAAAPVAAPEPAAAETPAAEPAASETVPAVDPAPAAEPAELAASDASQPAAAPTDAAVAPATPAAAPVAPAPDSQPAAAPAPVSVTVQPGFTLWGIAESRYGKGVLYVQVFDANKDKIKDPDLIYPGQVLTIPGN